MQKHLSTDNDPLLRYHRWKANLRILEIAPIKLAPHTPASHPFVECLIGSVRREYLDQTLFWDSLDLERKLATFRDYYNDSRVHSSFGGKTPAQVSNEGERPLADATNYRWHSHCGALYMLPVAA